MNEIQIKGEDAVSVISNENNLSDLIQPLTKEIHLFDTYVAGTSYLKDQSVLREIKVGDTLKLFREENKFDSNAILIFNQEKKKLGYIPEKDNVIFARLMDAGKLLQAKIKEINMKGDFYVIGIGIYLIDF